MANIYNSGQLAAIITQLSEMDVEDLGTNPNTFIYTYMNIAMMKLARVAYQVKFSDALQISSNGPVTFQTAGVDISDLYEPKTIYDSSDNEVQERTSFSAPKGWIKESDNLPIHVKGLNGIYTLKYLKYPARVSIETDVVEFPANCYDALIKEVVSLIKYSKNSYAGSEFVSNQAKESLIIASDKTKKVV